jgi:hypothetical protein
MHESNYSRNNIKASRNRLSSLFPGPHNSRHWPRPIECLHFACYHPEGYSRHQRHLGKVLLAATIGLCKLSAILLTSTYICIDFARILLERGTMGYAGVTYKDQRRPHDSGYQDCLTLPPRWPGIPEAHLNLHAGSLQHTSQRSIRSNL